MFHVRKQERKEDSMIKPIAPHGALGERSDATMSEADEHRRHHGDKDSDEDRKHKTGVTQVNAPKTEKPPHWKPAKKRAYAKSDRIHSSL
jgi:hypothetical protein